MLGLPVIEFNIKKQLDNLISKSPSLNDIVIMQKWTDRMIGNSPPFKGQIEYQARKNGKSLDLLVYWEGDSKNCQIVKIESISTYSEPEVLWERH